MNVVSMALAGAVLAAGWVGADEFHVSPGGFDSNPGTKEAPFRTIQRAAEAARPGDVITVHEGIYRERVNPPRGGESDDRRIVYRAAPGERAEIRGSEPVGNWVKARNDAWKVTIPNGFFGGFNPYADLIRGDWFNPRGRKHHTGAVYLDGEWLVEAAKLEAVLEPAGEVPLWFAEVDAENTTIWAQFKGGDPNRRLVEINVRRTVFYPDKPGRNYITVRGFIMRHAATPWAPPTAEQIGLIGTHWSKGWIIEDNTISHSICSGISLGKYGDEWDNTSANTAEGYVKTIERALKNGWNGDSVGRHVVRNNRISHCEQAGIVGSLGPIFCVVTDNVIHDIHVRRLFTGAEMAGIKFHGAIDTVIARNHIFRTCRGLWLDWMAQGTRVASNVFHDNQTEDLFMEVNHGPFLVDNNVFLSRTAILDMSEGGAYVHNLAAGRINLRPELKRLTPYLKPHSTEVAGLRETRGGDDRFCNNIFAGGSGLAPYDKAALPVVMEGNVFLKGARPSVHEKDPVVAPDFDPDVRLAEGPEGIRLEMSFDKSWISGRSRRLVTGGLLGRAAVPDLPYEDRGGAPVRVDEDFFGRKRDGSNPTPGPFEAPGEGRIVLKVR